MTPIQQYAAYLVAIETNQRNGRPVDPRWLSYISKMDAWAKANLAPGELHNAQRQVEKTKLQLMEFAEQATRQHEQETAAEGFETATRRMTSGMLGQIQGLSPKQMNALIRGEKIPGDGTKRLTQKERDAEFRKRTGMTEAEFEKRMDQMADADPKDHVKLADKFGLSLQEFRAAASKWRDDRIEHGLMKRRTARDEARGLEGTRREPTDEERRRAHVIDAYHTHTADQMEEDARRGSGDTIRQYNDEIDPNLYNEATPDGSLTRRAHLARNFSEVDE